MMRYISDERGPLAVQNFAENISELKNCADFRECKGKLNNIPCVIVTAGPSLDKNIDQLQSIKGRAFIICVYTAPAPLLRRGIIPDAVISMDVKQLARESDEAKTEHYNIPLIHVPTSPNGLLQKFTGIKMLCLTDMDGYLMDSLGKSNKLKSGAAENTIKLGGSVACSAIDFAVRCACDPIIFVGLDLAFADNQKTHAAGTCYDYTDKLFLDRLQMLTVPGVGGEPVLTADNMTIYRKWIEKYIALDKSGRTYIDATEGGALIGGTHIETLEDAKRKHIDNRSVFPGTDKLFEECGKMFTDNEHEILLSDIADTLSKYEDFTSELDLRISKLKMLSESDDKTGCRAIMNDTDDFIAGKNTELKLFSLLVNNSYVNTDKNFMDKSNRYYMNSFEFKLNFFMFLANVLQRSILTFKASLPINDVER